MSIFQLKVAPAPTRSRRYRYEREKLLCRNAGDSQQGETERAPAHHASALSLAGLAPKESADKEVASLRTPRPLTQRGEVIASVFHSSGFGFAI